METPKLRVLKSNEEWKQQLSAAEYRVLREGGTDAPWTGAYVDTTTDGLYRCRGCEAPLFTSTTKFSSHCGWPSFYSPIESAVTTHVDRTLGMERTEVRCSSCGSHLGHVFSGEGYPTPTDLRYCINSTSVALEPQKNESPTVDAPRTGSNS